MKAPFPEVHAAYEAEMEKFWKSVDPRATIKEALSASVPVTAEVMARFGWTPEEYHLHTVDLALG